MFKKSRWTVIYERAQPHGQKTVPNMGRWRHLCELPRQCEHAPQLAYQS